MFGTSARFNRYLEQQWSRLYRVAYSWSHDPQTAADLVQETLARALKHRRQLRDWKAVDVWLYRIMSHCWIDCMRRQPETVDLQDVELTHDLDPERENVRLELEQRVWRAIEHLSQDQRQIVTLVGLAGLAYSEVAAVLDIPVGTVMSRLSRARRNLRRHMDERPTATQVVRPQLRSVK